VLKEVVSEKEVERWCRTKRRRGEKLARADTLRFGPKVPVNVLPSHSLEVNHVSPV